MKWLSAALALLLLITSPVVGIELSEAYVESFLDSLPYRFIYWTRSEVEGRHIPHAFSTVQLVQEDGTVRYAVYVTHLAAPAHPGHYAYGDSITQYFYFVPTADVTLKLIIPGGREIPIRVTDKPVAPTEDVVRKMEHTISEFAELTSRYRSNLRDDSGEQFWSFLGLSLVMGGLTTLSVFGAVNAEDSLDRLAAASSVFGCGLLSIFSVIGTFAFLNDFRSSTKELREIEARIEKITAPSH